MVNTNEVEKILNELGFTKYETKIIIELYSRGSLKADELASYTGVPLARTYDTLEVLNRKNFVKS
ncbi:MAG: helix-turn-helix domain-containing protein, partial [Candidatus Kariarchaeaceae archaeon]